MFLPCQTPTAPAPTLENISLFRQFKLAAAGPVQPFFLFSFRKSGLSPGIAQKRLINKRGRMTNAVHHPPFLKRMLKLTNLSIQSTRDIVI
jgi:hypothetical protein